MATDLHYGSTHIALSTNIRCLCGAKDWVWSGPSRARHLCRACGRPMLSTEPRPAPPELAADPNQLTFDFGATQ